MRLMSSIALIAHDDKKPDLLEWTKHNESVLRKYTLYATGTTGKQILENSSLEVTCLKSGPKGGDAQIGAMIAEGKLDYLIFFWDPLSAHPHDVDVKALLRLAVLYDIPTACNKRTADYLITSSLFDSP